MSEKMLVFGLVTFLHDLFTVIWIGGLVVLGFVTLPATRQVLGKGPQMKQLMDNIQRRQSVLVYVSIFGLIVTGLMQARRSPMFGGLFSFTNAYSIALTLKHILIAAMIAVALYRSLALGHQHKSLSPAQEKSKVVLLFVNVGLGVLVLLLSGLMVGFSA